VNSLPLVLREAIAEDALAIEKLYGQLVGNPNVRVLPERITSVGQDPMTMLLVAELDCFVVGTVLVSLCSDVMFQNQPFAVVENIVVSSAHQNIGVGASLLREVERICQSAECSKIMLLSAAARADAHRFFESAGYIGTAKKGFVKYRRQFGVGA
jgi:predicted N-acetyltransferase YhbS